MIKSLQIENYSALFELVSDNKSRLIRYFPITCANCETLDKTKQYLERLSVVEEKKAVYPLGIFKNDMLLGMMYVKSFDYRIMKCEIGYFIDKSKEGQGIISEALKETVAYCFDTHGLNKVFLRTAEDNKGSRKVAEKNGFVQEGILREEFRIETEELVNVVYYGLLKKDFFSS